MDDRWSGGVWSGLLQVRERLAAIVPGLFALVTLVLLGVLVGWVAGAIVTRIARLIGFDRLLERGGIAASMRRSGMVRTPSEALGAIGFWAIFVLFASAGVDALAVPGAPGATALLLALLPSVFAALLVLIVGWLVANFLSRGLLIAAVNAGVPEARLLARAVHWGVVLFAGATALTHLGIGKEMVLVAFGITFGGLIFALALAFGLGGRAVAAEILARRLRRETPPPQERLTHL
jgi:hypothetical protein